MKNSLLLLLATLFVAAVFAQAPQRIPYQAVARDSFGTPIPNAVMQARFTIRDGSSGGTIVYRETDSVTTSPLGLFTVNIGGGTYTVGPLDTVNWASGAKYLQVEIDPAGGTSYVDLGANQLLSVPYALYANESGSGGGSAANGLHTNSGTIKLGGTLTDSITFVNIPFNTGITFSPDSIEIGAGDYRGVSIVHRNFGGDTVLGIGLSAGYGNLNFNKYLGISGANAPVVIVSEIMGDTAHFSGEAEVNVAVLHRADDESPIAFSGLSANPHTARLLAHGYSGVETRIEIDTNTLFLNTKNAYVDIDTTLNISAGRVAFNVDSDINVTTSGLIIHSKETRPDNFNIDIRQSDASEEYSTDLNLKPAYAMLLARNNNNPAIMSGFSATIDTSNDNASSEIWAKNDNYQTYINAHPFEAVTSIGYYNDPLVYTYMDTTAFSVTLKHGASFRMNSESFRVMNGTGGEAFTVDTFGAASLNSLRTGFTNKTSNYTLTNTDHTVNCPSGTFTLTLPDASGIMGRSYVLNNSGSGTITIATTSSQTIDGHASGYYSIAQWHNYTVQSDGANWIILSAK